MKQRLSIRASAIVAACLCAALILTSTQPSEAQAPVGAAQKALTDLKSVEELKRMFNADAGKTRLVMLLSPT